MSDAPRSRRTEIVMAGFRVVLGLLFLSVWGSNLDKGPHERLYGRPLFGRLPRWATG